MGPSWREVGPFIKVEICLKIFWPLLLSVIVYRLFIGREVGLFPSGNFWLFDSEEKLVSFLVVWEVLLFSFVSG